MLADRNKQLRIVAEMLLAHLPVVLDDQSLARDLLTVISLAIRAAADDAEKTASAWDKSILPLIYARQVNSPGSAGRTPEANSLLITC